MAVSRLLFLDTPDALARELAARLPRPAAVVGVGNPLRGDDGFGPAVVVATAPSQALRLFDVQAVPESFLMPIVESLCGGVVFVDAADLGAAPGRVALVPAERIAEVGVSTHVISLGLVAEAIRNLAGRARGREVACVLVAAQPQRLDAPDALTPAMARAVRLVAEALGIFAGAGAPAVDARKG